MQHSWNAMDGFFDPKDKEKFYKLFGESIYNYMCNYGFDLIKFCNTKHLKYGDGKTTIRQALVNEYGIEKTKYLIKLFTSFFKMDGGEVW